MTSLKFKIELNVLNHLGIGLYSSTPAVVTEIISNAWDADAENVKISLLPDSDLIEVEDDGHGMKAEDVQNKFLKVGYSRRAKEKTGNFSQKKNRRVMGRKGIGKLAMFSLANQIEIVTKAEDSPAVAFTIDVARLKHMIAQREDQAVEYPVQLSDVPADFKLAHGTRIRLTNLNNKINKTEMFLRQRLARRFGVFGNDFEVTLNNREIRREDANFYSDLQFLWYFDSEMKESVRRIAPSIAQLKEDGKDVEHCVSPLPAVIQSDVAPGLVLRGFIATVDEPKKLGKGDESLNRVSIFANGRLFQEDILSELGDARYFNSYLIGEIYADFLDQDDIDRATASREAIKHDDEKFQALRAHLKICLTQIRDQWDDWRRALGFSRVDMAAPAAVTKWLNGIKDSRDRKAADRLLTSIANLKVANDEDENQAAKKVLYKNAIIGFEKLRVRSQLDRLDKVTDVLSPEFHKIFANLDDIEESYYLDITRTRLEVIRRFAEEIVEPKKLEKVAQQYLFEHLWLLDPSWDRVTGSETWELTLTKHLKTKFPDAKVGARLDIAYRTTAGRHVIIELKKPGKRVDLNELEMQGRKYHDAMEAYYEAHPDALRMQGRVPPIDVYFLVSDCGPLDERRSKAWDSYNLKALTYSGMIENAQRSYHEYLAVKRKIGSLETILSEL